MLERAMKEWRLATKEFVRDFGVEQRASYTRPIVDLEVLNEQIEELVGLRDELLKAETDVSCELDAIKEVLGNLEWMRAAIGAQLH